MRRRSYYRGQSRKAGLPPGTLVHTGALPTTGATTVSAISYSTEDFREYHPQNLDQCIPVKGTGKITWINLEGLHDLELIRHFGDCYGLHPLILEDLVNTSQRPKLEDYGDYLFIVTRMIRFQKDRGIETEQVAMILGPGYLLSFQEGIVGDAFESVRERIRSGRGRLRSLGADYLTYALMDAIVDGYFTVLEEMGEYLEDLEEELAQGPTQMILKRIIALKREIIFMRKSAWPLREVTSALERGESQLIGDPSRVYFRDIYDHSIQVIDGVETFRDLLSGMLDLYLSSIGNRTNEVMKFLTVIGTIFLPLTFLVGVYGMNFKHIPELSWPNGYFELWGVMLAISLGMVLYFKRKRWL
ncbi:magnesium/cobalt transporter CorA [Pelobacter propionicus]|uniref:Magnesium transport protein CorA n=1 Tax=Pelobacter propionicus (strain DSM 2379 / NBRC 103807 / OttBd1) TaxID=338966 RepID=A1AR81_PELPD|nr:magnesium/cobalt transporter CorA [Pelobacter propionicus]ABK99851.1 magnesium and cobalt transport protein CorA [Pelobacter propionicus DSM 2379]